MVYAIISDIHANIDALEVVINDIEKIKPDRRICLGDIVGYCAAPAECIALVENFDVVLLGNHDYAINNRDIIEKFNFHARIAIEWTMAQLSDAAKQTLSRLPYLNREADLSFVHATPREPERWGYITNLDDALDSFHHFETRTCFIGHTHYPIIVSNNGEVIADKKYSWREETRYLVNVGSVGQPRDGDYRACYVVYDSDAGTLEYVRLKYDVENAQKRMRKASGTAYCARR